ncbi:ATP-grasp domain-containing protein [Streptomyces sp. NBRC 109706]|uniref:ATP-grasp domain-containing protein n=1 Tax=Streptomyces sp. NBRC 109706 TaxID=1550035 RepID=UPI000781FCA8|nr:ATP-grasp domain-containing protein [Streptomyces sp. NBRC 109706]
MQLLEHEAKALLADIGGLAIPRGTVVGSPERASAVAAGLGARVVVKAQVPTGGRGKRGGVRIVPRQGAGDCARALLELTIGGFRADTVLVEETVEAAAELYLAVALSPGDRSVVLLLSASGGVDVEGAPEAVAKVPIPALVGLRDFHVRQAASDAGVDGGALAGLLPAAHALYRLFHAVEADLVEVNPLFLTAERALVAGDVRVVPTAGGAYGRAHPPVPVTPFDRAGELGFDLVELDPDGDVGLLSTGAGASMLVVDLLTEAGVRPVDFCDLRSGRAAGVAERLGLVLDYLGERPELRCLAVNFFAGVTDLDAFGAVLVESLGRWPAAIPVVARIDGPAAESARERLRDAGVTVVDGLDALVDEVHRVVHGPGAAR